MPNPKAKGRPKLDNVRITYSLPRALLDKLELLALLAGKRRHQVISNLLVTEMERWKDGNSLIRIAKGEYIDQSKTQEKKSESK